MGTKKAIRAISLLVFCLLVFSVLSGMDFTKRQARILRCVGKVENFLPEGRRVYGSGTLLRDGYVLSCQHLIDSGVGQLIIRFQNGSEIIMRNLRVVSSNKTDDLALFKIDKPMPKGWGHIKIAKRLTAGDRLVYAGFNASALARLRFDRAEEHPDLGTMIHPIYFGDSGGGAFKEKNGRLVGVIHALIIDTRFGYTVNSYIGYTVSLEKTRRFLLERKVIK